MPTCQVLPLVCVSCAACLSSVTHVYSTITRDVTDTAMSVSTTAHDTSRHGVDGTPHVSDVLRGRCRRVQHKQRSILADGYVPHCPCHSTNQRHDQLLNGNYWRDDGRAIQHWQRRSRRLVRAPTSSPLSHHIPLVDASHQIPLDHLLGRCLAASVQIIAWSQFLLLLCCCPVAVGPLCC